MLQILKYSIKSEFQLLFVSLDLNLKKTILKEAVLHQMVFFSFSGVTGQLVINMENAYDADDILFRLQNS